MLISTEFMRMELDFFKPFLTGCSIETTRLGQKKLGELMSGTHKKMVTYLPHCFIDFAAEWVTPKTNKHNGVILYLHGGGYVSGDIEYAKGFGTILAAKNNIRVFCAAYRLAPENPFPAALEDALTAYQYLLDCGYANGEIILCGESAGGGLIYALCLKLMTLHMALPCGIIAISPWTDLTSSGASYASNLDCDPSMTKDRLQYYASLYTDDCTNPLVSPLFGDYGKMPPSLIFVGGDEIMLDDAVELNRKLLKSGSQSEIVITPKMWHGYVLYGVKETKKDHERIAKFVSTVLKETLLSSRRDGEDRAVYPSL